MWGFLYFSTSLLYLLTRACILKKYSNIQIETGLSKEGLIPVMETFAGQDGNGGGDFDDVEAGSSRGRSTAVRTASRTSSSPVPAGASLGGGGGGGDKSSRSKSSSPRRGVSRGPAGGHGHEEVSVEDIFILLELLHSE